jgi:hypothetical protein
MSPAILTSPAPEVPPGARRRQRFWLIAGVITAVVAVVGVMGFSWLQYKTRPVPQYASLVASPDYTVKGTVAYVDQNQCVRVVAAAGQPSKTVFCLPEMDVSKAEALGKETGPQLVWLPDGRLEITMFRFDGAPPYRPGWQ